MLLPSGELFTDVVLVSRPLDGVVVREPDITDINRYKEFSQHRGVLQAMWEELAGQVVHRDQLC